MATGVGFVHYPPYFHGNPTPAKPHECWIVPLDRSRAKLRIEIKKDLKTAQICVQNEPMLKMPIRGTALAVAFRADTKKPESVLRLDVWWETTRN